MDREGDPTTPGMKSLKRRKSRRAATRKSAKPRLAGTASRREQNPVGGFPHSSSHPRPGFNHGPFIGPAHAGSHGAPRRAAPPKVSGRPCKRKIGRDSVEDMARTLPSRPKGRAERNVPSDLHLRLPARSLEGSDSRNRVQTNRRLSRQEGTRPREGHGSSGGSTLWRAQPQGRLRHETRPGRTGSECKA